MKAYSKIKQQLVNHLSEILDIRIEMLIREIEMAKEARDNETKNSVGDKYETNRTMAQFELEKNTLLLNKTVVLKNELLQTDIHKKFDKAEFGSFVQTSEGDYFISIGLGKTEIENKPFYCISLASPIGKMLQNKKVGDLFNFQGKAITIINIF
jgi:transcription elongation GreA/GreB family factor